MRWKPKKKIIKNKIKPKMWHSLPHVLSRKCIALFNPQCPFSKSRMNPDICENRKLWDTYNVCRCSLKMVELNSIIGRLNWRLWFDFVITVLLFFFFVKVWKYLKVDYLRISTIEVIYITKYLTKINIYIFRRIILVILAQIAF